MASWKSFLKTLAQETSTVVISKLLNDNLGTLINDEPPEGKTFKVPRKSPVRKPKSISKKTS